MTPEQARQKAAMPMGEADQQCPPLNTKKGW